MCIWMHCQSKSIDSFAIWIDYWSAPDTWATISGNKSHMTKSVSQIEDCGTWHCHQSNFDSVTLGTLPSVIFHHMAKYKATAVQDMLIVLIAVREKITNMRFLKKSSFKLLQMRSPVPKRTKRTADCKSFRLLYCWWKQAKNTRAKIA